nr:uncharacterized mitochondrial protein AtMg00810-like [Tanacetum cinerariifolium]
GPMRVASINGKRYVLVIVDDYSRYTWVNFLRIKDETSEEIKNFLKKISVRLQAHVIIVRTDNETEFKNHVLKGYFDSVGITYETSAAKTPQQNGVVERKNRTLVEAARTMLIFSHASLFLWAEAIATAVYDRRTKKIMETMNVTFDELSTMAFKQNSSRPDLQSMTSGQISSELELTYAPSTITPQRPSEHDLDILFEPLHNEYLGGRLTEAPRVIPAAPVLQNLQAPNATMSFQDSAPKYGLNTCDIVGTPMDIKDKLDLNHIRTPVDATKYRSMIGALMYLTLSRPDIVHATCVRARYQAHPTEKHLKEVKRIFRYLRRIINMGLWYTKDSGIELTGFSDADYAGCCWIPL